MARFISVFTFAAVFLISFTPAFAQVTPTPNSPAPNNLTTCADSRANWQPDLAVTVAGKEADRSRQLLYWVFAKEHQAIDSAPIIATMWSVSRNIVYIFVVLVIVAFGFSYIFLKRRAISIDIPPILLKIGAVLLYATFSYILVLGLIQAGEIMTRFFIEKVGGQDLFNVIFAGVNSEKNYVNFIGYKDVSFCNQEAAGTSLFLIKITTFTYNIMAILMILRKIILWFLLILSPFLALLMPFVFIRNIGWIWIGVFFQWLFYGPMLALFLSSLTRIWVSGIPFAFDFSRVNKPEGQVFRTAINILYGGPAQTLTPGNSANYIDTYAEYVIALIMLWAAIILPWLLLRIFRDYCCAMIASAGATLTAIYDRLRQFPPPSSPLPSTPAPTTTAGMAMDLPFRKAVSEMRQANIAEMGEISKRATNEIAGALNMSVSNLAELGRLEMDQSKVSEVKSTLSKIGNPQNISSTAERERFSNLRSELINRAGSGDHTAQSILTAAGSKDAQIMAIPTVGGARPQAVPQKMVSVKTVPVAGKGAAPAVSVEDYEEVKRMWLNHYRNAPVPVSEKIKNRNIWLGEDAKHMTNTINLLSSANPAQRQKGLEAVSELLPFLLLGGYSDTETITYLRAKLEAAKQVQAELEAAEKAKEEMKKAQKEEEETLIPLEERKASAAEKTMEEKAKLEQRIPEEKSKKSEEKTDVLPKEEEKT